MTRKLAVPRVLATSRSLTIRVYPQPHMKRSRCAVKDARLTVLSPPRPRRSLSSPSGQCWDCGWLGLNWPSDVHSPNFTSPLQQRPSPPGPLFFFNGKGASES
jgi:hypothetical protein